MKADHHSHALALLREMDRLRRAWKHAIPNTGINKSEFFTLYTLCHAGGCSPSREDPVPPLTLSTLSKAMHQSMPAISQRITKLEELGYVRRVSDAHDRRTIWIHLTPTGYDLLHSTGEEIMGKLERILQRLDTQDGVNTQELIQSFHCFAMAMEEEFSPNSPQTRGGTQHPC